MKDYSVYPGEYLLTEETQKTIEKLKAGNLAPFAAPPMNMAEYDENYRIEIGLPGAFREEIFIDVHENILSVIVFNQKNDADEVKALKIHEFDYSFLERHIFLPENADTEFIIAEFNGGLLRLCVPKTSKPFRRNNKHIVVY